MCCMLRIVGSRWGLWVISSVICLLVFIFVVCRVLVMVWILVFSLV